MDDNIRFGSDPGNERPKGGSEDDSELGNLPPLSEFDSQGGFDSDGDLPPLGDFETRDSGLGAIPPIGNGREHSSRLSSGERTPPPSFGHEFSEPALSGTTGFQDLAADSDFSPETPDIGPGPDSTLDTPIFDSAFGEAGFGVDQTATATQAMESPIFDDFAGTTGFGGPQGATPMPDFSPDTGFGSPAVPSPVALEEPSAQVKIAELPARRGVSPVVVVVFGLVALVIGIVTSPFLADYLAFLPNPLRQVIQDRDTEILGLREQIAQLRILAEREEGPAEISEERLQELQNQILLRTQEMDAVNAQLETTRAALDSQQRELADVERTLRERNDEVVAAQEFLEDLRNETAIVQARQRGLIAEVDRLTGYVGELEEANVRRVATKEALEHNIDRLVIQVRESIPLAPPKYDHATRLARAEALREKAAQATWVTPELQNEYSTAYLRELEIARSNEYFFARIPVTDRFGHRSMKWAECLMRGNWAVYYRTLDGANIGRFENIGAPETPQWGFREDLPNDVRSSIEATIISGRAEDWEAHVQLLAQRELADKDETDFQRIYSSL